MAKEIKVQQRIRLVDDTGSVDVVYDSGTVEYTDTQIDNTLGIVSALNVTVGADSDVDAGNVQSGDLLFIKNTGDGAAKIGFNVGTSYYLILLESGESIIWRVQDSWDSLIARAKTATATTLSITVFNTGS